MSSFCKACPARLPSLPSNPCPRALEAISSGETSQGGCPWAVNSATHNYCFWLVCKDLSEPVPDREICALLGINQQTLDKTIKSALAKMQALKGTDIMNDFMEVVSESVSRQDPDHTIYLPSSFKQSEPQEEAPAEDEDAKIALESPKKKRKDMSMPMHRSGNKRDIYGIYGKKKLAEMRKAREKKN